MDGDRLIGVIPARRRRSFAGWVLVASGLLAVAAILLISRQPSVHEASAAEAPAAASDGNELRCDPATINRDNPAAGGIGPDCKYYPPIVIPPREVPDILLKAAHDRYVGRYSDIDPAAGREELKLAVLRLTPAEMEANRRYAVDHRWHRRFLADLDDAIAWGESLRAADPRSVYELAKAFRAAGQIGNAPQFAFWLHHRAMEQGLPEAIFDDAVGKLDDSERIRRGAAWHGLRTLAMDGYAPALVEITTRLREGRPYPPDDAELFFWLLRSQQAGLPVVEHIREIEARLSEDTRAWVKGWLERGTWPSAFDR